MLDLFKNLKGVIWKGSPNSTPSPASEDGLSPLNSQDGRRTEKSGLVRVLASRSARQEKEAAPQISAISGPTSADLSPSAALQSSLENRLRARMAAFGSPEYALTWKHWDIASGPQICALRASARRTSDNDSTGWPTCNTNNTKGHYSDPVLIAKRKAAGRQQNLQDIVQLAGWPKTPAASDGEGGVMEIREGADGKFKLRDYAVTALAGYTTPQAHDSSPRGAGQKEKHGTTHGCADLNRDALMTLSGFPTTKATDGSKGGPRTSGGDLAAAAALTLSSHPEISTLSGWATARQTDAKCGMLKTEACEGRDLAKDAPLALGANTPLLCVQIAKREGLRLNPSFSRWLMGFPAAWDTVAPLAARSK